MEELDYYLLSKPAWEKLLSWYGLTEGSQAIERSVHTCFTRDAHIGHIDWKVEICTPSPFELLHLLNLYKNLHAAS